MAALVLIFAVSPVHASKVSMCADDACTTKVKRQKLDCQVHKNKKKSLTFGFKLSVAFAAKVGPEATFGRSSEINWNKMSQDLIRRYEELCDFHNKGLYQTEVGFWERVQFDSYLAWDGSVPMPTVSASLTF